MAFISTHNLRGDIMGGITAGIVALPLALAFGTASGAGPIAGLWGAIIVGFFASLFGGTGPQVSGPTGPMVVVFAGVFTSMSGNPAIVFTAVMLAGLFMIAFGLLKMGQYIKLVPYPVISGFMSGIGCIIIALQTPRLFGHEPADSGTIPALQSIPGAAMDPNLIALGLGLLSLGIVFFWPRVLARFLPSTLAALIIGTLLSVMIPGAPILGEIPIGFPELVIPTLSQEMLFTILQAAFLLAVLGSIDSLLASVLVDSLLRTRHDSRKELIGQGIGNTIAGLFGAIPGAGANMRTIINIRAGGLTKISGMTHALVLLSVVLVLAPLAEKIPHAVLAGILIKVGYDILDIQYIKRAHRGPRWDLMLMALVLGLTVFVDLITAVGVGVVLAAVAFAKQMADLQLETFATSEDSVTDPQEQELVRCLRKHVTLFDFSGPLSFAAAADLGHHVRIKSESRGIVIINFSSVPFLDLSAAKAVETIAADVKSSNRILFISGVNKQVSNVLHAADATRDIPPEQWFPKRKDALKAAAEYVKERYGFDVEEVIAEEATQS